MKSLKLYLEELGVATPANTIGMGNPSMPSLSPIPGDVEGSEPGSGDALSIENHKKKKKTLQTLIH